MVLFLYFTAKADPLASYFKDSLSAQLPLLPAALVYLAVIHCVLCVYREYLSALYPILGDGTCN